MKRPLLCPVRGGGLKYEYHHSVLAGKAGKNEIYSNSSAE